MRHFFIIACLLTAACSNPAPRTAPKPAPAAGTTYTVENYQYLPLTAKAGSTLTLVDKDDEPHTFTLDDNSIDVTFGPKDPKRVTMPSAPGRYPFHCKNHPTMKSELTVS